MLLPRSSALRALMVVVEVVVVVAVPVVASMAELLVPSALFKNSIRCMQIRKLSDLLRGAKFTVTHRKTERIFAIARLTSQPAEGIKFTLNGKDGRPDRTVSVAQYFQEQYNTKLVSSTARTLCLWSLSGLSLSTLFR